MQYASERDFLLNAFDWPVLWDKIVETFSKRKYEEDMSSDLMVVENNWAVVASPERDFLLSMELHVSKPIFLLINLHIFIYIYDIFSSVTALCRICVQTSVFLCD